MSGLEPLVALGLACNIFQIVDTAKQSVSICRHILESGSIDPALNTRVQALTKICEELKSRQPVTTGASCTAEQQELIALAQSTITTATELRSVIDKLSSSSSKGKLLHAVKGTLKTVWYKGTLEKLEMNMLDTQRILETRLLVRVCSQNDALAVKQREDFSSLSDSLRSFISNYSQGEIRIQNLLLGRLHSVTTHIIAEATQTRDELSAKIEDLTLAVKNGNVATYVAAEASQTRGELSARIEDLKAFLEGRDASFVTKLLASFRYPSMNERRNQISETHAGTFEWIFGLKDRGGLRPVITSGSETRDLDDGVGFINWLQSTDQPLFWIRGKPGAGKSTLMKFVLKDDRTRQYLDHVYPNNLLVSHFIWSSGDVTQRSLKGLLCSLLYQLISGISDAPYLLARAKKDISWLSLKESPGDWSTLELKTALFSILKGSAAPVCILIDGLDEIDTTDGPFALLDVINQVCHIPAVKILVSSRPEPAFMSRLKGAPFLRVQDLTRTNILRYCEDRLASFVGTGSCVLDSRTVRKFADELSSRADGVFLWASLALKSLERGISNGDSEKYLYERLEGLPDDLNALYKNMWNRLNEDKNLYREEAAKYLNLALLSLDILEYWEEFYVSGADMLQPYGIVQMLAVNTQITHRVISEGHMVTEGDIHDIPDGLSAFLQAITVRCAGLLEIQQRDHNNQKDGDKKTDQAHYGITIGFVHRSAKEFLCNTMDGHEILQHDKATRQDNFSALLKAHLARDLLLSSARIRPSAPVLNQWTAQYYTFMCCHPRFRFSLWEIMDVLEYVERYQVIVGRTLDGMSVQPDQFGMLILASCPEIAILALEAANDRRQRLSVTYLGYLLMLATQEFLFSFTSHRSVRDGCVRPTAISVLTRWKKVDVDARSPIIEFSRPFMMHQPIKSKVYLNSPLFDAFLSGVLWKCDDQLLSHLIPSIIETICLFLNLGTGLARKTLMILKSECSDSGVWYVEKLGSIEGELFSGSWILILEVNAIFLLKLIHQRLELHLGKNERGHRQLSSIRAAVARGPAHVRVLGARHIQDGIEANTLFVPNDTATAEKGPDFGNEVQNLTWTTRTWGFSWHLEIPGCLTDEDLIRTFKHESREITTDELYKELVNRGLVVTDREVNPDTWPPPRHASPESPPGGAWR